MTLSIEPQTVQEGERVVFTCQATANPEILGYRCKAWGLGAPWGWSGRCGGGTVVLLHVADPAPSLDPRPVWPSPQVGQGGLRD